MPYNSKEGKALALVTEQLKGVQNPVVLCSFGKDSIVLLHLCLRVRKVPVLYFKLPKFNEKHTHAHEVITRWDLEVYDFWPQGASEYQHGDYFDVFHHYATGNGGYIHLSTGIRKRQDEQRYLCAVEDLILRPKSQAHDYAWDVTFHGHKGVDDPKFGSTGQIVQPVSPLGRTLVVMPLHDWTDQDIWNYIKDYDLPYDHQRYEKLDGAVNPDEYPTCYRCIDTRLRGQAVACPKYNQTIINIARPDEYYTQFRESLVGTLQYCEVSGEPRSTPHVTGG